jgi:hypothetical protein
MTPKEQAQELFNKMFNIPDGGFGSIGVYEAKQCALVAVDEILKDLKESLEVAEDLHPHAKGLIAGSLTGWQEVKQEIEKL